MGLESHSQGLCLRAALESNFQTNEHHLFSLHIISNHFVGEYEFMQPLESRLQGYLVVPSVSTNFEFLLALIHQMPQVSQDSRSCCQYQTFSLGTLCLYLLEIGLAHWIEQAMDLLVVVFDRELFFAPGYYLEPKGLLFGGKPIVVTVSIGDLLKGVIHHLLPSQLRTLLFVLFVRGVQFKKLVLGC